jgi:very-short-patch-repair endonuclease
MKKMTTEDFISKSMEVHGNKYDYSLVLYKNIKSKVKIVYNGWVFEQKAEDHLLGKLCELRWDTSRFIFESIKIHGNKYDYSKSVFKDMKTKILIIYDGIEYLQNPSKHLMGRSPEKGKKLRTTKEFIEDSIKIWGYKYDYSLVEYKGSFINVAIKYKGKIYYQKPSQHLSGYKCECANVKNTKDFIDKSIERHGDKYDYSLVEYKGIDKKVKILYQGVVYEQKAGAHLYSSGLVERVIPRRKREDFILSSSEVHDSKYDYSLVEYSNNNTKVIIICPTHGEFLQRPSSHLQGHGCSSCMESKGEKKISHFLSFNNINYLSQHRFNDCRNILSLPFDFYIPSKRMCIEFDGIQHFEPIDHFGGVETFEKLKTNDKIKNDYCEDNYINLIRIRYDEVDNIEKILKRLIYTT